MASAWTWLPIHRATAIDIQQYPEIRFWIHGGSAGGQQLRIYLELGGSLTGGATGYRFDPVDPLSGIGPVPLSDTGFEFELPPRSATLVVAHLAQGSLFADGFESGDTSVWSATAP